ncbi:reticulon-like protein B9 [Panicum miliaceum]|uniref:Reticulon-like protein n=1 Tax=Panicum miliaceum TaxID=4540 RepID=A0A3L6QYI9_PANMI|nr:reticulon-like protein B9 [Panicum miliaceum]
MATTMHGHGAPRLFGRERTLHAALGGRGAADIILWRDKKASAAILAAATAAWGLFEVAEFHFLTLVCYAAMIGMLVFFIWSNAFSFFNLPVPRVPDPETLLSERATRQAIQGARRRLSRLVETLYDIACGKDIKMFILTVFSLYIASVIADCFSSLTLLYLVVFGTMTLPALYERYDSEVDHLVARGVHDLRTHFADIDSGVLRKIPRGAGAAAK